MEEDLSRCPKCNHFWTSHGVRVQGLTREPFCWTANCDCTMDRPHDQKAIA